MNNTITDSNNAAQISPSLSQQQSSLVDSNVSNENDALNVMVSFLHLAQKRGAFNFQESAKIWECVKLFIKS